jgi:multiple antibiotic resistance protein
MLRREHPTRSGDDVATALSAADQLIVPVAMPLIAGPGTIIAAMTLAARARPGPPVMVLIAVAVTALAVWLVLAMSGWMQQRLGARGQAIVVRFMACARPRRGVG